MRVSVQVLARAGTAWLLRPEGGRLPGLPSQAASGYNLQSHFHPWGAGKHLGWVCWLPLLEWLTVQPAGGAKDLCLPACKDHTGSAELGACLCPGRGGFQCLKHVVR